MLSEYRFPLEILSKIEEPQLKLFENDFKNKDVDNINIEYTQKGYVVNDKQEEIIDSATQVISFFSGAGGFDIGAQLAGAKVISTLDFNKDSVATIKKNQYFSHAEHLHKDIKDISAKEYETVLKKNNPEKLFLIGGPPCQPFSKAGYWVTHENRLGSEDPRNMIGQYLRLIEELSPDGFILENVESILHPRNIQAVHDLQEAIEKLGYNYITYKANAVDFGVPQKRKRVFFIASKNKLEGEPVKTHGSKKDMLQNPNLLPHERVIDWIGEYNREEYNIQNIEGKYKEELVTVPPGQNYIALTKKRNYPNPKFIAGKRYWSFLLKLHPNLPSWTIIASPGHWEGPFHWENRRLNLKERASIQTFPTDYEFVGAKLSVQKQIGNAVPPILGEKIMKYLISKH